MQPDVIGITESWCNETIKDSEVAIEGFNTFRLDKGTPTGTGGGVILYIRNSLTAVACHQLNEMEMESSVWCVVQLEDNERLLLGLCYRSPNSSEDNNRKLREQITSIKRVERITHVLVMGDFNFSEIDWVTSTVNADENSEPQKFYDTIQDEFLAQHVEKPTRHRQGQRPSLLDLVITSDESMVEEVIHYAPLGSSDHDGLFWEYTTHSNLCTSPDDNTTKDYNKGNYNAIKEHFRDINWNTRLDKLNCQQAWNVFKEEYNQTVEANIPEKKKKKKKPPWLKAGVKKAIRKKYELFQKYRKTKMYKDYEEYRRQSNKTKKAVRCAQAEHEKKLMKEFKKKPKAFYSYVRSKQKVKVGISQLEKEDGSLTQDDTEAANVLNDFFKSVFTREPDGDVPTLQPRRDDMEEVDYADFTLEDVSKKLDNLKPDKSPGIDSIHPNVLRECSKEMAVPLFLIFKKSIAEETIPDDWKRAKVVPIYKKGSKTSAGNYRPVSLTSIPCKVMESLIRDTILNHVTKYDLLSCHQHGFTSGRSCLTNLLDTLEDITKNLDEDKDVDIIYLDYSKAFDTVPHRRLLSKLEAYGITGKVLKWIEAFLTDRKQQVGVRRKSSDWADVISGVPQGSVLGPILFVIYINDLPDIVSSLAKLFADDTKLYNIVGKEGGSQTIQGDLNTLEKWSDTWLLRFNAGKCKCMHMGNSNQNVKYTLNGEVIQDVNEEKDLGVYLTSDCKPSMQCTKAAATAMQSLRTIKRTFKYVDKDSFAVLYKAYIRPHLEYSVQAWSPYFQKDIKCLEKVQRRATKMVPAVRRKQYDVSLKELKLFPLEVRRIRGDLIEVYKILHGLDHLDAGKFFSLSSTSTRGHSLKLYKKSMCKGLQLRKYFFSQRVIINWNKLPAHVVVAKNVNEFKKYFDQYLNEKGYGVLKGVSL